MQTPDEDIRPHVTEHDVIQLTYKLYGMRVSSIKSLNGYDDKNFLIHVEDQIENDNISNWHSAGYVFKVLNTVDSMQGDFLRAQIALMQQLRAQTIVCPVVVPSKSGEYLTAVNFECDETRRTHIVRLLEYIDGDILYNAEITKELLYEGGCLAALIQNAVQGFQSDHLNRKDYPFNLLNLRALKQFLPYVQDESNRELASLVLDKWEELTPLVSKLPKGPIHGDLNEQNIIIKKDAAGSYHIDGIIDFGDVTNGHSVFDVGIYIMYMMCFAKEELLDIGGYCLAGYLSCRQLADDELSVIYYIVAARFCQSLLMGAHNYSIHKDPYYLMTQRPGWIGLRALWSCSSDVVLARWLQVAKQWASVSQYQ